MKTTPFAIFFMLVTLLPGAGCRPPERVAARQNTAPPKAAPAKTPPPAESQGVLTRAKAENKMVLLDFTGSDWCGWCIRLNEEVFSKREFEDFTRDNLIFVEVDFPRRKTQSQTERESNEALARKFKVEGFPTCVLLDADGAELGRLGYLEGGAGAFIGEIKRLSGGKSVAPASRPVARAEGRDVTPAAGLKLQGVSGPASRRLALINGQTLGVGETATIKFSGNKVRIRCVEIRADTVVVALEPSGEKLELTL